MWTWVIFLHAFGFCVAAAAGDWSTAVWDVIVVGAGPAGIIVAERMAEANLTTLLIEGGGPSYGITGGNLDARRPTWLNGTNLTRVDVPGLYKSIFADGGGLTCGPLTNAYGGCTIGGSSAINAGLFFEPPESDFDLYFPAGWKSADMKTAIAKVYAMQPSTNTTSQDKKRYLQSGYEAARKWLVDELHFKETDINRYKNNKTQVFGHPIYDYANGQRGGPVTTYLQKALKKPMFHLQSGVRVIRVQRQLDQAIGVVVSINNAEKIVKISTHGRVILSAGAIQSPSLLMFSGIGDPAVLSRLQASGKLGGLPSSHWINNTAVGANLFDNPNTFIELQSPAAQSYSYSYASPVPTDESLYLQQRSGPYTFASQTSVFWDSVTHTSPSGNRTVSFQGTIDSSGYGAFTDSHTITLNIYGTSGLLSRGKVVLDNNFIPGPSADVYYSVPSDALDIATFIHKIFAGFPSSAALAAGAEGLTPLNIPATASVAEIQAYITTGSAYARGEVNHWTGSCGFHGCVDAGRGAAVRGMRNLHVVDASLLEPVTVNPQFGVMAVAERAVELILGEAA